MARVQLRSGIELAYDEHGSAAGPPLVLVAPLGRDRTIWGDALAPIAADRRCITFDHRGTGESSRVGPYSIAQFAQDTADLVDALGCERVDVLGSSMGAAVAQELAITRPELVGRLVLVTPWARTDENLRHAFLMLRAIADGGTRAQLERAVDWFVFSRDFLNRDPDALTNMVATIVDAPGFPTREGNVGHIDASIEHDALDRLPGVAAPTLVIAGEGDRLTPPEYAQEVCRALPNADLVLLRGATASHGLTLERLDEFVAATRTFLGSSEVALG